MAARRTSPRAVAVTRGLALLACLVAGAALWCTRGTLDAFGDGRSVTRVAALPSGAELLGLIALMLIAAVGTARCWRARCRVLRARAARHRRASCLARGDPRAGLSVVHAGPADASLLAVAAGPLECPAEPRWPDRLVRLVRGGRPGGLGRVVGVERRPGTTRPARPAARSPAVPDSPAQHRGIRGLGIRLAGSTCTPEVTSRTTSS